MSQTVDLVLFDLDGTLVDTAPDLAAAANRMRARRGLAPLPLEVLRPVASHGARGLLGAAFDVRPDTPDFAQWTEEFLNEYAQGLCIQSRLFDGMDEVLHTLEARGLRWGVVTNKVARFTAPLMSALNLHTRAACVVSGDTTPYAKPHPAPLLHALALCAVPAHAAIYVGDDARDIIAGRAAGMRTLGARYGYLGSTHPPEAWGADGWADTPLDVLNLIF